MMTNHQLLGRQGPSVFPLALGLMGMSGMYGESDENESIATIHAALERGINLFDTGDFYGMGHNELLLGRALRGGKRDSALISVKFGAMRDPAGNFIGFDGRPAAVKTALAYTLVRLGVDHIDIYRPARLDPSVPIEETIGAIADLVTAGYVRHIGLSEVGPETIARAAKAHPIVDLQIEYSLISRGPEDKIFPLLRELGIGVTAYGVLSRGLLAGSTPKGAGDFRSHLPRFTGEAGAANAKLAATLARIAGDRRVTPAQLAIAWSRARYDFVLPTVGSRTRAQLAEALGALDITLTRDELTAIEGALPAVAGSRYQEAQMRHLDSERLGREARRANAD